MSEQLNEALAVVAATASADTSAATEAALEAAQEATERAEETAEQIAAAAMESERGRMLEELRQEIITCQGNQSSTRMELQNLTAKLAELTLKIEPLLNPIQVQLTPLPSAQPAPLEAPPIVAEVVTAASDQSENIESAVLPKRVKRFL